MKYLQNFFFSKMNIKLYLFSFTCLSSKEGILSIKILTTISKLSQCSRLPPMCRHVCVCKRPQDSICRKHAHHKKSVSKFHCMRIFKKRGRPLKGASWSFSQAWLWDSLGSSHSCFKSCFWESKFLSFLYWFSGTLYSFWISSFLKSDNVKVKEKKLIMNFIKVRYFSLKCVFMLYFYEPINVS